MRQDAVAEALRILHAAQMEKNAQEPSMTMFRRVCGAGCAIVSIAFLTVNTVMLARFGFRMGHDEIEQWSQAIIAGTIPWVLALLPFILMSTWVPARSVIDRRGRVRRKRGRPSFATLFATALYVVFVAVNFIGGIGVMAVARQHVAGKAKDADNVGKRLEDQRALLMRQMDGVGKYRPADEVESLISRHQQHRFWRDLDRCNKDGDNIKSRAHRNYCSEYDGLVAELGRARKGDALTAQIAAVDAKLADPTRSQVMADDAQATVLAYNLGIDEQRVRFMLPLLWPLLLELGSMLMAYFALKLFRVSHHSLIDLPEGAQFIPAGRQLAGPGSGSGGNHGSGGPTIDVEPIPLRATTVAAPSEDPVRQRAVFDEFWAKRVRRSESGQVPEATFYTHYQALCSERLVVPLDLQAFQRLSSPHVGHVVEMGGVRFWCNLVPTDT